VGVGILRDYNNAYPDPIDDGETIIAASYTSIASLNKKSGELMWQTPMPSLATSMGNQGGVLLAKLGMVVTTTTFENGDVKSKGQRYKPFGFVTIDINSGKEIWSNTEFNYDPLEAIAAVFDNGILYGCDGDDLYAISTADGKRKWSFNIKNDGGAGKITGDKAWASREDKRTHYGIGSITTTTWSNPRRILRADYRTDHFIVYGDKKIIRVDKDGQLTWAREWKYDPNQKNLLFDPTYVDTNDDIVYACKGFYGIDGKTGEIKWGDKDVKGEFTLVADDLLIVRKKDQVQAIRSNKRSCFSP
jgi:outer membrane protein assembly factor BamB